MKRIVCMFMVLVMLAALPCAFAEGNAAQDVKAPRYVFLFIGDGMSYPQFQSASDYLGALADDDYVKAAPSLDDNQGAVLDGPIALNFMNFETAGSVVSLIRKAVRQRIGLAVLNTVVVQLKILLRL